MTETTVCPVCGAPGDRCRDQFDAMLAREFTDPIAGSVHFYTVTCHMLQHDEYSASARSAMISLLARALNGEMSVTEIRDHVQKASSQEKRAFRITRQPDDPPFRRTWNAFITDVTAEDSSQYCEQVLVWARSVSETASADG